MMDKGAKWIWFRGDFEIYHGMLQNFQREERGYGWPAYWKMDDWNKNVRFERSYVLDKDQPLLVHGHGTGYVSVNDVKYPLEREIPLFKGRNDIKVFIGNMTGLPCIYIDSGCIKTDESWVASDFVSEGPAGVSSVCTHASDDPNRVPYQEETVYPKSVAETEGGLLLDFGRLVDGTVTVRLKAAEKAAVCRSESVREAAGLCGDSAQGAAGFCGDSAREVTVCCGESPEEAMDETWCYYKSEHVKDGDVLRKRAFRYLFLPGVRAGEAQCEAVHLSVPIPVKAAFSTSDDLINRIWDVARETYGLCGGMFFIDGAKRDRWIWSGDAYQSYFVNPYLYFDPEIDQRTTRALRGNTPITQHINTIVDYSMLWLISIENHYMTYGNLAFVEEMYPKMEAMFDLFRTQLDSHGFIYGRERDWIYIDWADIERVGPIAAEQMLLLESYHAMAFCGKLLGKPVDEYERAGSELRQNIIKWYWDEELGAFIDSYESDNRNVTRHANIFAILFSLVDAEMQERIFKNVLLNDQIPAITTPYFKFFELDVWGKMGRRKEMLKVIRDYWGGMLERGAVTFWELFDPAETGAAQYAMYGDPFGKSLCHAWAASPIYLLGRYFLGVYPTAPGYETFAVEPHVEFFDELDCIVPVAHGKVHIVYKNHTLTVTADREGGVLRVRGVESALEYEAIG